MNRKLAQRNPVNIALAFAATVFSLLAASSSLASTLFALKSQRRHRHVWPTGTQLKTVPVPEPPPPRGIYQRSERGDRSRQGPFLDTAIGSDGQACASCHFHAGADSRSKNQLNPASALFPRIRLFCLRHEWRCPNYQLKTQSLDC